MGNAPNATPDTYAHMFDERDLVPVGAAEAIGAARAEFDVREGAPDGANPDDFSKPTRGFEPRTPSLRVMCSTS